MGHLHQRQIVQRPGVALGAGPDAPEHLVDRQFDVLVDRQPRQQRVVLEHHSAVRSRRLHGGLVEDYRTQADRQQAGDHIQQRGLAAPGVTDDRDELALVDWSVMRASSFRACIRG